MVKMRVAEHLESLGLKDHGTANNRRALFHYEHLLRLYENEIASLFGRLKQDEGIFLDRDDPDLFQTELDELLTEFGPLIWPSPGQGSRDHLLEPAQGSRYTSDLLYPRDKEIMVTHLRNLILSKNARPGTDFEALIARSNKEANLGVFQTPAAAAGHPHSQTRTNRTKPRSKCAKNVKSFNRSRQVSMTDERYDISETEGYSGAESEDSVVDATIRRRVRTRMTSASFRVALRLFRKTPSDELLSLGPCCSYGTIFLDDEDDSAAQCLARIDQHTGTRCVYIEFHLPEDMTLKGKIRIHRGSDEADDTFEQVITMLRNARKFLGEPSYRTVEVEIGTDM